MKPNKERVVLKDLFTSVSRRLLYFALLFLCLSCATAAAAPVQRIREIQRPLWSTPVFVLPGGWFDVSLKLGGKKLSGAKLVSSASPDSAISVEMGAPAINGSLDDQSRRIVVSDDIQEGLYDMAVYFTDGSSDIQPHSVKVIKEFKKDFDFVHLTDIHFNLGAEERNRLREQLLRDISALNPEFVVFGGDLGLAPEGYDRDYSSAYESFLGLLTVPVFSVPGNHELYVDNRVNPPIDGRDYWAATFGPFYNSFDYGALHVSGINTFDWPDELRDHYAPELKSLNVDDFGCIGEEQWEWLQKDFAGAAAQGRTIIAYTHIPLELLKGGARMGAAPSYKIPGPSMNKFFRFLDHYGVPAVFVGHLHFNSDRVLTGNVREIMTLGAGSNNYSRTPTWGFRVVHVRDGKITGSGTHERGIDDKGNTGDIIVKEK